MQLSEIRSNILTRYGLSSSDQMATPVVLNQIINSSLRRVSTMADWPWLESTGTTTVNTDDREIPGTAIRRMLWMNITKDERTTRVKFMNQRSRTRYIGEGKPVSYTDFARVYTLYPNPDQEYDVEYGYVLQQEPTVDQDTDEPLITDSAIELLISDACLLLSRRMGDRESEAKFYQEQRSELANTKNELIRSSEGILPSHNS